jgi:hypothetical protein
VKAIHPVGFDGYSTTAAALLGKSRRIDRLIIIRFTIVIKKIGDHGESGGGGSFSF